jgi:hypothetical protein
MDLEVRLGPKAGHRARFTLFLWLTFLSDDANYVFYELAYIIKQAYFY